jgi:hypothetical protein
MDLLPVELKDCMTEPGISHWSCILKSASIDPGLLDQINLLVLNLFAWTWIFFINYASYILNFASSLLISKFKLESATRLGAINCRY